MCNVERCVGFVNRTAALGLYQFIILTILWYFVTRQSELDVGLDNYDDCTTI